MAQRMMIGLCCLGGGGMVNGNTDMVLYFLHHLVIQTVNATPITTSRAMTTRLRQILHTGNTTTGITAMTEPSI
jgi:hypothetical protein